MSNKRNPRIYITIPVELKDALDNLHSVTGFARSQVLTQLLSEVAPVINAMADAFRLSKKAPSKALEPLHGLVEQAAANLGQLNLELQKKRPVTKIRRSPKK